MASDGRKQNNLITDYDAKIPNGITMIWDKRQR